MRKKQRIWLVVASLLVWCSCNWSDVKANRKLVALSYDDGPNSPYTEQLLDALRERNVPATFFLVGLNVEANPATAVRMAGEGHEIGSHTYSHHDLTELTDSQIETDVLRGVEAITQVTGTRPRLFRSPYAESPTNLTAILKKLGLTYVDFQVVAFDWQALSAQEIANNVIDKVFSGAIILMHDGESTHQGFDRSTTIEASKLIIRELSQKGYKFVTVSRILASSQQSSPSLLSGWWSPLPGAGGTVDR